MSTTLNDRDLALGAMHAEIADRLGCSGWTYRDLSWVRISVWNEFLEIAEHKNIKILARTIRGDACRGQVLISPEGLKLLAARIKPKGA